MNSDDPLDNVTPLFGADRQAEKRQQMVETWEAMYLRRGQSLTDKKTADSLRVAVEMMTLLLNGAEACDMIDVEQRDQLLAIFSIGNVAADEWQS
jgi:hypothetical protein